ncbi:retroviral-like aspartic protease family protein [Candidatus Kuenenbacteria bacterium]|nr:retroviral-like aspartic protease family protein [Candidatus Kuenenbacteria bacterium]
MALDTGATYLMIPWRISESLGLRAEISKEKISMTTASGTEQAPLVTLKSVKAFGREVKEIKTMIHDLPSTAYVDGLLGLSFIKNFKWEIDFYKGTIKLF